MVAAGFCVPAARRAATAGSCLLASRCLLAEPVSVTSSRSDGDVPQPFVNVFASFQRAHVWAARCARMDAMCSTDTHVTSLEVVGLARHTCEKAKCWVYLSNIKG